MKRGWRVCAVDRFFFGKDKLGDLAENTDVELVTQDIRHLDPAQLAGIDGVVDLAGLSNDLSAEIDPDLTRQINIDGGTALARAAKAAGVRRYVYASSASVYGHGLKTSLAESDECRPQTLYAQSKLHVEKQVRELGGKDFEPVVRFAAVPNVLVVNSSLPVQTLAEFTDYARGRPGALNYASAGNGSSMHLAAELYQKMSATKMVHIPFVSPGQATQDTIANRTQLIFHLVAAVHTQVKAGKLRALAVLDRTRSGVLPSVPTTAEAGMPGLEGGTWYVMMVPAGSPAAVIAKGRTCRSP